MISNIKEDDEFLYADLASSTVLYMVFFFEFIEIVMQKMVLWIAAIQWYDESHLCFSYSFVNSILNLVYRATYNGDSTKHSVKMMSL